MAKKENFNSNSKFVAFFENQKKYKCREVRQETPKNRICCLRAGKAYKKDNANILYFETKAFLIFKWNLLFDSFCLFFFLFRWKNCLIFFYSYPVSIFAFFFWKTNTKQEAKFYLREMCLDFVFFLSFFFLYLFSVRFLFFVIFFIYILWFIFTLIMD